MKRNRRFNNRAGYTLIELLVTLLIVGLVSMVVAEGIGVAVPVFDKIVKAANTQTALSTNLSALRSELTTATIKSIDQSSGTITYTKDGKDGAVWTIKNSENSDSKGIQLTCQKDGASVFDDELVSSSTINNGEGTDHRPYRSVIEIDRWSKEDGLFWLTVKIMDGDNLIAETKSYCIRVLGGIEPDTPPTTTNPTG